MSEDARLRAVIQASSDTVIVISAAGTITWTGPRSRSLLGLPPGGSQGFDIAELLHPDDVAAAYAALTGMVTTGRRELDRPLRLRLRHVDGHWVTVEVKADNLLEDPEVAGVVVSIRDISERVAAETALERERAFSDAVLDTAGAVVVVMTPTGEIVRFNRAAERLTGYSAEEVVGRHGKMLVAPGQGREVAQVIADVLTGHYPNVHENDWVTRSGKRRTLYWTNTALPGADGAAEFVICTGIDVTAERVAQRELARQATHDSLTGLPNRALLLERMQASLRELRRDSDEGDRRAASLGVLFVDLDGFKDLNDRCGHAIGDRVLVAVAGRLRGAVSASDTVARLGGDEFIVLCVDPGTVDHLKAVAHRVQRAFVEPVGVGEHQLVVAASVGMAIGVDPTQRPEALLDEADRRMYQAKRGAQTGDGLGPAPPPLDRVLAQADATA